MEDWEEDIREWYLRTLHPFRISEVLKKKEWNELFAKCPLAIVHKDYIVSVCQAHGENPAQFYQKEELKYLSADDVDPLFCTFLLRLGDLLDFDDTRAPKILYGYVECNEKSRNEWDKHRASAGFRYPDSPSTKDLPYKAHCTNPGIEHTIRDFLDWIDDELGNCIKLQKYCEAGWRQEFPFPRGVLRDEIKSDGYMSGDFCLTMDQTQVLKLLTGENLYKDIDVFVRELLQNAIDATLLRGEMESGFKPEQSRIDLWEWNDKDGNIWFRIDDEGTGMTLGMLQRYFLKVGNSYYNSRELKRDLRDYGKTSGYHGISRFGIGFLSSFLCGDYAEVSTLYFDSEKNRREESSLESYPPVRYGLRLQVTGLNGYYTLKNQSKHHQANESLPKPDCYDAEKQYDFERDGYRTKPGTSIVIRLNPGKLGALDLRKAAENYLLGTRVPVYCNNKRIGNTYEEIMQTAHKEAGEKIYELPQEMKDKFDRNFSGACGQYPKVVLTIVPLDTEENHVLSGISGVLIKYNIRFDKTPQWKVKDQTYSLYCSIYRGEDDFLFVLNCMNTHTISNHSNVWEELKKEYDLEKIAALEAEFEKLPACPQSGEQLGNVWQLFSEHMNLYEAWTAYHDYKYAGDIVFSFAECGFSNINGLCSFNQYESIICAYQGITAGRIGQYSPLVDNSAVFLLEGEWKPMVEVSRSNISGLPLTALVAICGILNKHRMLYVMGRQLEDLDGWKNSSLREWREVRTVQLHTWMMENQKIYISESMQGLQEAVKMDAEKYFTISCTNYAEYGVVNKYLAACFQDSYRMTINYEEGQIISFEEKEKNEMKDRYDLFPPMMFCMAATSQSRQYICSADSSFRRGITADHPFIVWLLDNAFPLSQYYQRQFQQIVECLCYRRAELVIEECNNIRKQLISLPEHHGVDVNAFPQLSMDDFWK